MSEENKPEETTVPTPPVGEDGKEEGKAVGSEPAKAESRPVENKTEGGESVGAESAKAGSSESQAAGSSESKTPAATDAAAERAAARAARLAARAAAEAGEPAPATTATPASADAGSDEEKAAKAQAAAEARAARAAARGAKTESADPSTPKEPSPNQPLLDRLVAILKAEAGEDAVVESFINERDAHRPYVIIHSSRWPQAALTLRNHEELRCDYLRNLSGVDQETHLEVAYHLLSLTHKHEYCVKVKTDREQPSIPSVADVWPTANWNEREAFDLFGIDFPGHPNLVRIMMPDDWVGHPLRKDYEPLDPEV
ncbi:NAD(P)H-quinone oxidoreductase subunit J, chloroplastic [Paenibacillus allorhizoplanae]|uniref:NADH-quinone oxidoreductase subunit C n=1 Tax=Paenibacillus allorhizoplanae TaxID=2905648 RepID=A0ABN8GVQ7_9BACL|nr:NADH-quinone oxidoreductase subunit C [Paenibacillus allorhizoplanae]CAH1216050.1 NAD(P)H-quinone oxidoreductase subunit J, chloroplastic [Paenibacillus allorhizoplanae]